MRLINSIETIKKAELEGRFIEAESLKIIVENISKARQDFKLEEIQQEKDAWIEESQFNSIIDS